MSWPFATQPGKVIYLTTPVLDYGLSNNIGHGIRDLRMRTLDVGRPINVYGRMRKTSLISHQL